MKRAMDFSLAAFSLLLLFPVFIILAIIIGCQFGVPIVSASKRPGLHGNPFYMYKFRTVSADAGRWSEFLRQSKLEELPQLWNILRGEMSFVGPCPIEDEFRARCSMEQVRRFHVKPGLTGWAQVNRKIAVSWAEKCSLDVWYVDNRSITLDFQILWLTLSQRCFGMERFPGSVGRLEDDKNSDIGGK